VLRHKYTSILRPTEKVLKTKILTCIAGYAVSDVREVGMLNALSAKPKYTGKQ
jgi:hypothetical protein